MRRRNLKAQRPQKKTYKTFQAVLLDHNDARQFDANTPGSITLSLPALDHSYTGYIVVCNIPL